MKETTTSPIATATPSSSSTLITSTASETSEDGASKLLGRLLNAIEDQLVEEEELDEIRYDRE